MVADVQQLQGLCERMHEEAFLPLTQEDFGISIRFSCKHWVSFAETPF